MRRLVLCAMALCAVLLAGCFAPVVEGGHEAYDAGRRSSLEPRANAGDPVAQYQLGSTYCCETGGPVQRTASVYDNNKATEWLCKSAFQGYGPAQYKLARIYSGRTIEGVRLMKRAGALVGKTQTDLPVALMWATLAAQNNVDGAAALRDELRADVTPGEAQRSQQLLNDWHAAPCVWREVFRA